MIEFLNQCSSLPEAFFRISKSYPEREVYRQSAIDPIEDCEEVPRSWSGRCYLEVRSRVIALGSYLLGVGMSQGDRVAILSYTRPEWMEADIAVLSAGGVSVSIYQSLTALDIGYILFDSEASIVFAENQEQVDKLLSLHKRSFVIPATEERPSGEVTIHIKQIITFERTTAHPLVVFIGDLLAAARDAEDLLQERIKRIQRSDLAALVYTSGTTGAPKGVMQTHENHLANVRQVFEASLVHDDNSIFLLLPLAHSFAKLMGYIGFITPVVLLFPGVADRQSSKANPNSVTKDLREAGAQIVPVVPRLLEKMQAVINGKAKGSSIASTILRLALQSGSVISSSKAAGKPPPVLTLFLYALTGFVRRKIRRRLFGEHFLFGISGGAKLPIETGRFFQSIGADIYEGYGLTETCVATNVCRPGKQRLGTVGPVLTADIQLKLESDGEICFRGPNVTSGYWKRPTATAQSWDSEGWFHTGDLGSVDAEGNLSINGRKKELIVTSGGKKIPPDPIEQKLKSTGLISQAVLVGEGRNYVVALVTLDEIAVEAWAKRKAVELHKPYSAQKQVVDLVNREVEKMNISLASFETVKRVRILDEEMTVENGLLTPTFKVKRKEVEKRFGTLIDSMYSVSGGD